MTITAAFWYTCSLPGSETEGTARGICSACAALRFPHPQLKSRKGKRQPLPAAACFLLFAKIRTFRNNNPSGEASRLAKTPVM